MIKRREGDQCKKGIGQFHEISMQSISRIFAFSCARFPTFRCIPSIAFSPFDNFHFKGAKLIRGGGKRNAGFRNIKLNFQSQSSASCDESKSVPQLWKWRLFPRETKWAGGIKGKDHKNSFKIDWNFQISRENKMSGRDKATNQLKDYQKKRGPGVRNYLSSTASSPHIKLLSPLKDFRLWSNENFNMKLHFTSSQLEETLSNISSNILFVCWQGWYSFWHIYITFFLVCVISLKWL